MGEPLNHCAASPLVGADGLTFGARLRSHRQQRRWTLEYVAGFVGVTRATVSAWEHDAYRPSLDKLIVLAGMLRLTLDAVVRGTGASPDAPDAHFALDEQERALVFKLRAIPDSPGKKAGIDALLMLIR